MSPDRVTRREMLKAILAAGGAVSAASFIPEKWLKPVVGSGVLPAHAQGSIPQLGTITGLAYFQFFDNTKPIENETVSLFAGFINTTAMKGTAAKQAKTLFIPDPLQTTQTDANGGYGFTDLAAGQYTVMLDVDPFPYEHVDLGPGEDATADLVIDSSDG